MAHVALVLDPRLRLRASRGDSARPGVVVYQSRTFDGSVRLLACAPNHFRLVGSLPWPAASPSPYKPAVHAELSGRRTKIHLDTVVRSCNILFGIARLGSVPCQHCRRSRNDV